jgi:hypothetical protein
MTAWPRVTVIGRAHSSLFGGNSSIRLIYAFWQGKIQFF